MLHILLRLVDAFVDVFAKVFKVKPNGSDAYLRVPEIIESRGFNSETHSVTTSDGYILTLHRIVNPFVNTANCRPVLLQHGFSSNSSTWIIASEDGHLNKTLYATDTNDNELEGIPVGNNLGFELAKRGFDVWMGNNRGNKYSNKHLTLDSEQSDKFWDFSVDELIAHDMPAIIDYILQKTSKETLAYVGHSQGSTIMFGLLASQLKYNDIIKTFIAIAPATTFKGQNVLGFKIFEFKLYVAWMKQFGSFYTPLMLKVMRRISCGTIFDNYFAPFQLFYSSLFGGRGFGDPERVHVYGAHFLDNFSRRNLVHIYQLFNKQLFAKYDWGREDNVRIYGTEKPPVYHLDKVNNRFVALIYSDADMVSTPEEVKKIAGQLKVPLLDDHLVSGGNMTHLGLLLGTDAGKYVNSKVISLLGSSQSGVVLKKIRRIL